MILKWPKNLQDSLCLLVTQGIFPGPEWMVGAVVIQKENARPGEKVYSCESKARHQTHQLPCFQASVPLSTKLVSCKLIHRSLENGAWHRAST